jgi:hypothetical protein
METTMLKQEVRKVMVVSPPADERPLFAPEFVRVMTDSAYETLRAYLEKAKARPEAISLLDDLVLLLSWRSMQERGKVTWRLVAETVNQILFNKTDILYGFASMQDVCFVWSS